MEAARPPSSSGWMLAPESDSQSCENLAKQGGRLAFVGILVVQDLASAWVLIKGNGLAAV